MADDFTIWCPSIPLDDESEWRLSIAKFGDGYEQRALDGINALKRTWSVAYEYRDQPTIQAMHAYLVAQKAKSFPFLDRGSGETVNVFCDKWTVTWQLVKRDATGARRWGSLKADFRLANGVTA
jgi:phage-related protein